APACAADRQLLADVDLLGVSARVNGNDSAARRGVHRRLDRIVRGRAPRDMRGEQAAAFQNFDEEIHSRPDDIYHRRPARRIRKSSSCAIALEEWERYVDAAKPASPPVTFIRANRGNRARPS